MKLAVTEFEQFRVSVPAVIYSLDRGLYQVMVVVDGEERLLVEDGGRAVRRHSIEAVRGLLRGLPVASLVMRHRSAYDEMVGQPARLCDNTLEIPLALDEV